MFDNTRSFSPPQSFSHTPDLSPECIWNMIFTSKMAEIAWRKPISSKSQTESQTIGAAQSGNHFYAQSKLTGSPAYKELKNLIVAILLNNNAKNKPP